MIILALICAVIAALCTIALFQIFRGVKTKNTKKIVIGVILLILTFIIIYYLLVLIMVNAA